MTIENLYKVNRGEGFGSEVKRRVMLGTFALSEGYYDAYYNKASCIRRMIQKELLDAFKECDVLITPMGQAPAFKLGELINDPLKMYATDMFTIPSNLAGLPSMSLPCSFSKEGLPIGLQIIAKPFAEEMLLRVAYAFEQNTQWHKRKPKL